MGKAFGRLLLAVVVVVVAADSAADENAPADPPPDDPQPPPGDAPPVPPPSAWEPAGWPPIEDTPVLAGQQPGASAPGGPPLAKEKAVDTNQFHSTGDPIAGSGEFVLTKTDLKFAGFGIPFEFTRVYRSQVQYQGPLGYGWTSNFHRRIVDRSDDGAPDCAGDVFYVSDNLERIKFSPAGVSASQSHVVYSAGSEIPLQLDHYANAADPWVLQEGSGLRYYFDAIGGLHRIQDPAGNAIVVTWDHSVTTDDAGIITKVTDTTGRVIYFHHRVYENASGFHASAVLQCLSLADNCNSPLVSFQMSSSGENGEEYDLVRVLDANGKGPTYSYNTEIRHSDFVADADVSTACHQYCDPKTDDPASCHNFDACSWDAAAGIDERCNFDQPPLETFVGSRLPNFQTTTGKQIHVMNGIPMGYVGSGSGVLLDWDSRETVGRYPGFGFCVNQCLSHYDQHPNIAAAHACYSDVFPLCLDLSLQRLSPAGYGMTIGEWFVWREGCGCGMAADYQFCRAFPTDVSVVDCPTWLKTLDADLKSCHAFPSDTSEVNCPKWLTGLADNGVTDLDPNMMSKYAVDCRQFWRSQFDSLTPACRSNCYSRCTDALSAKDSVGNRRYAFGRIQQLNHNLVEVDGGDGRLVLVNSYGTDLFDASFDRVIAQQLTDAMPDNVIKFDYHDLTLEQSVLDGKLAPLSDSIAGASGPLADILHAIVNAIRATGVTHAFGQVFGAFEGYSLHLDPAHVVPLNQFSSVEICPSKCVQKTTVPIRREQDELIPIARLNPADRAALLDSAPIYLQKREGDLVEVVATKKTIGKVRADALLRLRTANGEVTVLRTRKPDEFQLVGEQSAIDQVFGSGGQLTARLSQGARAIVTPKRAAVRSSRAASSGVVVSAGDLPAQLEQQYRASIVHPPKMKGGLAPGPLATSRAPQLPKPRAGSLFTSLYARGFAVGSAPLTLTRAGPQAARITSALPAGTRVEPIMFLKGSVGLIATGRPNFFRLDGKPEGLFDASGRARIFSGSDGSVTGVPADQASAAAKKIWKQLGSHYDVVHWTGDQPAIGCQQWVTTAAHTAPGAASAPQMPRYAVVVHDLHGVTRTNYYDSSWRLLRVVNHDAKETSNYNYQDGSLAAAQLPAGDRICQEVDFFAHPLQVAHHPAPGYGGDAQPQISAYAYNADNFLTDVVTDAGGPSASTIHLERDAWDRVTEVKTQVDAQHAERTLFGYDQTPPTNPHSVNPNTVTRPDGSIVRLTAYDPRGGGPQQASVDATGTDPLHSTQKFDPFGRLVLAGRTNHAGSQSHSQYDAAGMLIKEGVADLTAPPGSWVDTTITYNDSEQTRHVSDPKVATCFDFDALDQMHVAVEQPKDTSASKSTCYKYDPDGRLEYVVHPEGNVSWFQYDAAGRLTSRKEGFPSNLGPWTDACLNSQPPPAQAVAAHAAAKNPPLAPTRRGSKSPAPTPAPFGMAPVRTISKFHFDACTGVVPKWPSSAPPFDPGIQTLTVEAYQPGGFPASQADGSGVGVKFTTDGFGRAIVTQDGVGNQLWRGYDTRNRITWEALLGPNAPTYAKPTGLDPKVPLESMVEFVYDDLDRITQLVRWHFADRQVIPGENLKLITRYTYDDANARVTIAEDDGALTVMERDGRGRLRSMKLPDQSQVLTQYSENGKQGDKIVRQQTGPNGLIKEQELYDNQAQLKQVLDDKNIELWSAGYDRFGRKTSELYAQRVVAKWSYDAFDRITSLTQGAGTRPDQTQAYGWNRNDQLISIVTANAAGGSHQTVYALDGLGRELSSTDPLGRQVRRDYYPDSLRLRRIVDNASQTIQGFAYDTVGRLQAINVAPGTNHGLDTTPFERDFTYTPRGQLATAALKAAAPYPTAGLKLTFDYDSLGNRISESSGGYLPIDIAHAYDLRGRPRSTTLTQHGGGASASIARTFDARGRVTSASVGNRAVAALKYQGLGTPVSIQFGQIQNNQSAISQTNYYDHRGRFTGLDVLLNNSVVASLRDGLGLDGAPRARQRKFGAQAAANDVFEVDDSARLVAEGLSVTGSPVFGSDLTNQGVDASVQTGAHWRRYEVDGVANWSKRASDAGSVTPKLDALDGYAQFGSSSFTYDDARNTTAIGGDSFKFDGLGELVSATVNGASVQFGYDALGRRVLERSSGEEVEVIWDGAEIAALGSSRQNASSYTIRVGGDDVDDHLALVDRFGAGTVRYLHQTADASVIAATSDQGLLEGYSYSGFGETAFFDKSGAPAKGAQGRPSTTSTIGNRLLFQGQLYDGALQSYSMRAREYQPALGRFLSPDPIGLDGGTNLYAFVDGRPSLFRDPFGLRTAGQATPRAKARRRAPLTSPASFAREPRPDRDPVIAQGDFGLSPKDLAYARDSSSRVGPAPDTKDPRLGTWVCVEVTCVQVPNDAYHQPTLFDRIVAEVVKGAGTLLMATGLGGAPALLARGAGAGVVAGVGTDLGEVSAVGIEGSIERAGIERPLYLGPGSMGGDEAVARVVNSNMAHAAERAVERAGFATETEAREALQSFGKAIKEAGRIPTNAIVDPARANRIIVPGFGQGGAVVYQVDGGKLTLKTVLQWIPPK